MVVSFLICSFIIIRLIEVYFFIKRISKVCHQYDWKHVNQNDMLVLEIIKKDYYLTNSWSAYNFLYLKGPSPLSMFFSLKKLTIEKQYSEEIVKKINKYEN